MWTIRNGSTLRSDSVPSWVRYRNRMPSVCRHPAASVTSTPPSTCGSSPCGSCVVWALIASTYCGCTTREGMAIARAKGQLKGRAPKLSAARQAHLLNCTPPAPKRVSTKDTNCYRPR
ncbi:hypothetical protein GCM10009554_37210 [Kribbella koreensis]|uniref:Resolvase/invertase-type recombinase catalytic domain-containing protein n=2 Tax=Kribbella TaxID=182639 RepID=A0ABP6X9Y4_9ACTN